MLYIDNILSETKETQWLLAQKNEAGEVHLMERRRIKGVFLETLELNDFPLDVQVNLNYIIYYVSTCTKYILFLNTINLYKLKLFIINKK